MTAPYLLVSDIHAHKWSTFATVLESGVNSRLQIQCDELLRAAKELQARGGDRMFIAGDIFHTRGSIDPEVFNVVHETFQKIIAMGVKITAIPGNHDLVGRDTTTLGNAFQTLDALEGFHVVTELDVPWGGHTPYVMMIPWCATKDELRQKIGEFTNHWSIPKQPRSEIDLIIHVGIDGMLDGMPPSGLSAAEVASWGFKRVFAGDYHNHRIAEDGKVISIGALTHNTWGDIGTKAGFLLVYPDRVEYQASHAPSFVELTRDDDPDDYPLIVDGNYVRIRGMKLSESEIVAHRKELMDLGARGVVFQVAKEAVVARATGGAVTKAASLDESVDKFVDTLALPEPEPIKAICADVLNQVRSVTV